MITKDKQTAYFCPVDGHVTPDRHHTHKYEYRIIGDRVSIRITNFSYLTTRPITATIETTKQDIESFIDWSDVIGSKQEILLYWPPEFIETIAHCYPNELQWAPLTNNQK